MFVLRQKFSHREETVMCAVWVPVTENGTNCWNKVGFVETSTEIKLYKNLYDEIVNDRRKFLFESRRKISVSNTVKFNINRIINTIYIIYIQYNFVLGYIALSSFTIKMNTGRVQHIIMTSAKASGETLTLPRFLNRVYEIYASCQATKYNRSVGMTTL